jgi:aryl-alcohol dehydrogenase-like predicted oxidoreductase
LIDCFSPVKIALGTVQFGLPYGIANQAGQVSRLEAKAMLQLAAANGVDTLDTAISYGESETCLGELGTQGYKVVTKLPMVPNECADLKDWVQKQVTASLSRLGVSEIYGLLLHRPEQLLGPNGKQLYQILQELKVNGLVQKVGVSIYAPSELIAITKLFRVDLVQSPFNLVDRRLLTTGWLQRLKAEDVEIHTRSTFLQGLLLTSQAAIPAQFAPWNELWRRWHQWLEDHDVSAVQACLAYPLSFSEIDRVIVGADSVCQLAQIINAARSGPQVDSPELRCEDESLINPSHWSTA